MTTKFDEAIKVIDSQFGMHFEAEVDDYFVEINRTDKNTVQIEVSLKDDREHIIQDFEIKDTDPRARKTSADIAKYFAAIVKKSGK